MKGFRCYNCDNEHGNPGLDFLGDEPKCPQCGLDGTDKRYKHLFAALKVIHFDAPDPSLVKGSGRITRGVGHAACNPEIKVGKVMASGEPNAVNCPACKDTEVWKLADKTSKLNPEDDFPVELDLAGTVLKKG